jgi:hypothetical protein
VTGSWRKLVAVGTPSDSSMFAARRAAGPFDLDALGGPATILGCRRSTAGSWQLDAGSRRLFAHDARVKEGLPLRGNRGRIAQIVFVQRLGKAGVGGFERVYVGRFHGVKSNATGGSAPGGVIPSGARDLPPDSGVLADLRGGFGTPVRDPSAPLGGASG